MSRTPLVLGIDGGGTKSIGLISDVSGNILTRREAGPANPNVVGFAAAAENLFNLICGCCEDVRSKAEELRSIVLGLAGAGVREAREQIIDGVNGLFVGLGVRSLRLSVETDARVALEGAFDGGPGVVIVSGTGSIVIGKNQRGDAITVGGWGRILGDEGSGFHVGREGVRAVTLVYDGRGEATNLKKILSEKYGWNSRDDIITQVYQGKFELSTLAPDVMEAAIQHDGVCQRILQNAATQLVEQARGIVMQMGLLRKVGLVRAGSLIDHETVFANVLQLKIMKSLPQVDVRPALHSPAHGAVFMAIERAKKM